MEPENLALIVLAFALGGILKGATGAGAPLLAVPVLVVLKDVQFAVAVFVMSNIIPNLWQGWVYRHTEVPRRFMWAFAISGGVGAGIGTLALAEWNGDILTAIVAVILVAYIAFRLLKPSWELPLNKASKVVLPIGVIAGALQGASGLSAPVSITFLNAIRLERKQFIATISLFFATLGFVQLPLQIYFGIMTGERFVYSTLALIPLLAFMPVGAWIGARLSRAAFDKLILVVLSCLALKLVSDSLF